MASLPNSFVVGGLEMVGSTTNPEYRVATGIDTGQIAPVTASLSSLLLDGAVITGETTGNRIWQYTVIVYSLDGTRLGLATAVDTLLASVNADTFPVVWTAGGCPSTNYTGYRATTTPAKSLFVNDQLAAQITITYQSGPFGQSSSPQSITVASSGAPVPVQVDGMNSGSFTNGTLNTSTKFEGAGSMAVTMLGAFLGGLTSYSSLNAGRTITSIDLSSYGSFSVRFRWDQAPANFNVTVFLNLKDSTGKLATGGARILMVAGATSFTLFSLPLISFIVPTGFDWTTITSWGVQTSTNSQHSGSFANTTAFVDDLRAYPPGSVGNSTSEGAVLTIPGVIGSARTPIGIESDIGGTAFTSLLLHSPPVSQDPDATILAGLSAGTVTIPTANFAYDGTYSLVAVLTTSGTSARAITATVTQTMTASTVAVQTLVANVTGTRTLVSLGEVTLPLAEFPADNTNSTLTIAVASGDGTDVISDVCLLDTEGQTVMLTGLLTLPGGGALTIKAVYVDPPDPAVGIGPIYAAKTLNRTQTASAMAAALISGGPILFEPGNNRLLAVSAKGAPNVTVTYTPAWLDEALV